MSIMAYAAGRENPRVVANRTDASLLGGTWLRVVSTARQLHRNAWFPRALENLNTTYLPCPQAIAGNPDALRIFTEWAHDCSVRGHECLDDVYHQIISQQTINGDVLVLFLDIPGARGLVRSRLCLVDSTRVRTPSKFTKSPRGNQILHGVEVDAYGQEIGYWVCGIKDGAYDSEQYTFYPVDDAETGRPVARLLRRPDSVTPSSTRGLPSLTWIVGTLKDIFDLENATVQAAQVRAMLAVILASDRPNDITAALGAAAGTSAGDGVEGLVGKLDSGMVISAPAGTTPHVVSGSSGNIDLVALFREVMTHMTASLNWPLSLFLGDYTQVSYSGFKAVWDRCQRMLQKWQDSNAHFLDDVFRWVVAEGMLASGTSPSQEDLVCTWSPIVAPDPNPIDTERANELALRNGTATRSQILAAKGIDYKTHLLQQKHDSELETLILGAPLGSPAQAIQMQAQAPSVDPMAPALPQ